MIWREHERQQAYHCRQQPKRQIVAAKGRVPRHGGKDSGASDS